MCSNLSDLYAAFIQLVRLGVGTSKDVKMPKEIDWSLLKTLADEQGLSPIILDALNTDKTLTDKMPLQLKLNWIGEVIRSESKNAKQRKAAHEMSTIFNQNNIRTYVLKGAIVAECYPNPQHRLSSDMDCFLIPAIGNINAWAFGNNLMEQAGFEVKKDHYKNSTFYLPGLMVENHEFLTPFRSNRLMKRLEVLLQSMIREDHGDDKIEGTCMCRPPVMLTAIFLIEHAYSHFLHEGLTWRHVLDWMMYSQKHQKEIDWAKLEDWIDEFGFRRFYDTFLKLGKYLMGEIFENDLTRIDKKMLEDVWAKLDLHNTVKGVTGKMNLAGNTWRARWKYRYFTEITWLQALWMQTKGFLFEKHPKLNNIKKP